MNNLTTPETRLRLDIRNQILSAAQYPDEQDAFLKRRNKAIKAVKKEFGEPRRPIIVDGNVKITGVPTEEESNAIYGALVSTLDGFNPETAHCILSPEWATARHFYAWVRSAGREFAEFDWQTIQNYFPDVLDDGWSHDGFILIGPATCAFLTPYERELLHKLAADHLRSADQKLYTRLREECEKRLNARQRFMLDGRFQVIEGIALKADGAFEYVPYLVGEFDDVIVKYARMLIDRYTCLVMLDSFKANCGGGSGGKRAILETMIERFTRSIRDIVGAASDIDARLGRLAGRESNVKKEYNVLAMSPFEVINALDMSRLWGPKTKELADPHFWVDMDGSVHYELAYLASQ